LNEIICYVWDYCGSEDLNGDACEAWVSPELLRNGEGN
jgi:hypothetical protein